MGLIIIQTAESVFEIAYSVSFKNGHYNWWLPPALGGRREWAPNTQLVSLLNDPAVGGGRSALIAQTAPPGNLWYGKLYCRTQALLLAIENERQLEFAFEGDRWFNLVRTGRVAAVLGLNDSNRYRFPIPADELLADKDLDPNPGY